jgi:hypothetical protein
VNDAYSELLGLVQGRLAGKSSAEVALVEYEQDPLTWSAPLGKTLTQAGVTSDQKVVETAERLMALADIPRGTAGRYTADDAEPEVGPDTLTTRGNLAASREVAGDPADTSAALNDVLTDQLPVLGPDHPETLTTREALANSQGQAGDPAGAAIALQEVLNARMRVLGPDHPETLTTRSHLVHWRGKAGDRAREVGLQTALHRRPLRPLHPRACPQLHCSAAIEPR